MMRLAVKPARQSKEANNYDRKVTKDDTRSPSSDHGVDRTYKVGHGMTSQNEWECNDVSQAPFSQEHADDERSLARHRSTL
jgi:hypothetical protein